MPRLARNLIRLPPVASAPGVCEAAKIGLFLVACVIGIGVSVAEADLILVEDVATIYSMAAPPAESTSPESPGEKNRDVLSVDELMSDDALPSGGAGSGGSSTLGVPPAILCPLCCVKSPDQLGRLCGELSLFVPLSPIFERLRPPRIV